MEYTVSSIMALISHIHTISADFTNRRLAEKGLVSSHGHILYLLSKHEQLTMGDLAAAINRNKSTTTVLIRRLKDEGLIREETSKEDCRAKYISLTEAGKAYNKLTASISKDLLAVCYRGFSAGEKDTLLFLLRRLCGNIEDAQAAGSAGPDPAGREKAAAGSQGITFPSP